MPRTGGVVALVILVVLVLLAGCTGLADDSSETPVETPTETETPTPEPTPVETETPMPEATPTPEYDADDPSSVHLDVFKFNRSQTLNSGHLTITDENGSVVSELGVEEGRNYSIAGLTPGENYTATVSEVGLGDRWPDEQTTFDPGDTDTVELVTADIEFNGTETYRYQMRFIVGDYVEDGEIVNETELVDGGHIYTLEGYTSDGDFNRTHQTVRGNLIEAVNVSGEKYATSFGPWMPISTVWTNPTGVPEHKPTRESLDSFSSQFDRTYITTKEFTDSTVPDVLRYDTLTEKTHIEPLPEDINGTEVHVFEMGFSGESEWAEGNHDQFESADFTYDYSEATARVYVETETGHILRWYSDQIFDPGHGRNQVHGMADSIVIYDFFDHDSNAIEINPDDYPPFADD